MRIVFSKVGKRSVLGGDDGRDRVAFREIDALAGSAPVVTDLGVFHYRSMSRGASGKQVTSRSSLLRRAGSDFKPSFRSGIDFKSKSFGEVVSSHQMVHDSGVMVKQRHVGSKEGRPSIRFSHEDIQEGARKFQFAIVIQFANSRPPARELQRMIYSRWNLIGGFSFCELWDSKHVLCILQSEVDVKSALSSPVRRIGKCMFKRFRWTVEFDPFKEYREHLIWLSLPRLPLFLFDKEFAGAIVSGFTALYQIDECSSYLKCLNKMRVRVKVDGECVIPDKVWVELPKNKGYWQDIELEDGVCFECRMVGHNKNVCRKKESWVKKSINDVGGVIGIQNAEETNCEQEIESGGQVVGNQNDEETQCEQEDEAGWQVVSRSKKRTPSTKEINAHGEGMLQVASNLEEGSMGNDAELDKSTDLSRAVGMDSQYQNSHASCHGSPAKGQDATVEEGQHYGFCSTKSLAKVDNRMSEASSGAHALVFVGQSTGLVPSLDRQSQSQKPMARDYKKMKMVSSGNKRSGLINADGKGLVHDGSRRVVSPVVTHGQSPNDFEKHDGSPSDVSREIPSPITLVTSKHGTNDLINAAASGSHKHSSNDSPNRGHSKAGHCDSIELLRKKKLGRPNLADGKEGYNDQISLVPMSFPEDKIASYGNDIICYDENFVPLDAKALYLRLKPEYSDDAEIFHLMDRMCTEASQIQKDRPSEESDGSIDLSRILKQPRQKSRGSRKKKGSNVVY